MERREWQTYKQLVQHINEKQTRSYISKESSLHLPFVIENPSNCFTYSDAQQENLVVGMEKAINVATSKRLLIEQFLLEYL